LTSHKQFVIVTADVVTKILDLNFFRILFTSQELAKTLLAYLCGFIEMPGRMKAFRIMDPLLQYQEK